MAVSTDAVRTWVTNRLYEGSTYVGAVLVASGNWGISSSSPTVQQVLDVYNHVAPQVGAALVAMSTRHP
jgi:hypothetical protein